MSNKRRIDWSVCGRPIGTATGWDQGDTFSMIVYDFIGNQAWKRQRLPEGDITLDFEAGTITTYKDDGAVWRKVDLVQALYYIPKASS